MITFIFATIALNLEFLNPISYSCEVRSGNKYLREGINPLVKWPFGLLQECQSDLFLSSSIGIDIHFCVYLFSSILISFFVHIST